jgi:hypothetical protein
VTDVVDQLTQMCDRVANCDVSHLDGAGIHRLISTLRRADRALTALKVRAGQRSDALAQLGVAPDASEAFIGTGEVSSSTARRDTTRSRIVEAIPDLSAALDEGRIDGEHLDAIASAANKLDPELRPLFDAATNDLINRSSIAPVDTFSRNIQRLADRVSEDHGRAKAISQREAAELSMWESRDGMGHRRATFDPEWFAALTNAISREASAMANQARDTGEPLVKGRHLDAAALIELVQAGNGAKGRPEILVVVDAETACTGPHDRSLRQTRDGHELSYDTITRLACDSLIRRVLLDERGVPIDVGRSRRTAGNAQWAALNAIYSTCAWHGCDRPISWCQAHHINEWDHGGPTDLDNLVPLCSRHHHAVHEGQWSIKLLPDRTLRIFRPDGIHHADTHPDRLNLDQLSPDPLGADQRRP